MSSIKKLILKNLISVLQGFSITDVVPQLTQTSDLSHGDYSSNIALQTFRKNPLDTKSPAKLAEKIKEKLFEKKIDYVEKIEVAKPGFINFWISRKYLLATVASVLEEKEKFGQNNEFEKKKIMVEYAHPNTHKELHIGHMRTLITGEALSRIFESNGAEVFRANYQGDIGPHVAKALFGVNKIMEEKSLTLGKIEMWTNEQKAHFLGEGYIRGNKDYEANQDEVDFINVKLYQHDLSIEPLYQTTRQWSLDYYDDFYKRFYAKFDHLFFESEMVKCGVEIVKKNIGKVFEENEGAVIFPGKKYGLHTRVFITAAGHPTYEGKEMCNAYSEYEAFPFDKKIHVVGSEQSGYFKVVFKALELIDSVKFEGKQYHLPMGMVQLEAHSASSGQARKISSRTGEILRVDWLIDQVKERVNTMISEERIGGKSREKTLEAIAVGAIKYSVLRVNATADVSFDIEKSLSLDGDSGPYLQYSYVRTQSILARAKEYHESRDTESQYGSRTLHLEEELILRLMIQFPYAVELSASSYSPHVIANYLFSLAQAFNVFYQKHSVLAEGEATGFRLSLTAAVGQVLKNGLEVLGIKVVERM